MRTVALFCILLALTGTVTAHTAPNEDPVWITSDELSAMEVDPTLGYLESADDLRVAMISMSVTGVDSTPLYSSSSSSSGAVSSTSSDRASFNETQSSSAEFQDCRVLSNGTLDCYNPFGAASSVRSVPIFVLVAGAMAMALGVANY